MRYDECTAKISINFLSLSITLCSLRREMVVEIMTNELSGMGPAPVLHHEGSDMFAAYSIDAFTDVNKFKKDMDLLLKKIVDSKPADGFERVVYAGLMESEEFAKRTEEGIPYHKEVIEWFENYCGEIGIECELR